MRSSHGINPLHRIERWTGSYFREAYLWEVGLHILVVHHTGDAICPSLKLQTTHLEHIQTLKDQEEQMLIKTPAAEGNVQNTHMPTKHHLDGWGTTINIDDDATANIIPDNPPDDAEGPIDLLPIPPDPMPNWAEVCAAESVQASAADTTTYTNRSHGNTDTPAAPKWDAMMNPYVRVVHTNGIHYIGLVYCVCHGAESAHADMLYSRLVPTSFDQYRTLFTTTVLDDFRLSNLECKTSAYQYFQKLRRETAPASPAEVVNRLVMHIFCHGIIADTNYSYIELRRLSRQWRWLKQLKWAGYSHTAHNVQDPRPGELTLFCPACPQPGINLPDAWQDDINK